MRSNNYVFCEDCRSLTIAHIGSDKTKLDEASEHFNHKINYNLQVNADLVERGKLESKLSLFMAVRSVKKGGLWKGLNKKAEDSPQRTKSLFTPK